MTTQIFISDEKTKNEEMIDIALRTGRILERLFPDQPDVATVAFQYASDRPSGQRGRRILYIEFVDPRDAVLFKLNWTGVAV